MATGVLPFRGTTSADTFNAILNKAPTAPVRINPDLPDELERIINKALEKDRDLRCQSASEIRADLKRLKRSSDSGHKPAVIADSVSEKPARRWMLYGALGIVLILVATGAYFFFNRSGPIESIAVFPLEYSGSDAGTESIGDGLTGDLINSLTQLQIPNLRVIPRSTVSKYKGENIDYQNVAKELNAGAYFTGKIDTASINAELVDTDNLSNLWGKRFDRRSTDLITINEEIQKKVAENLRLELTDKDQELLAKRGIYYKLYQLQYKDQETAKAS